MVFIHSGISELYDVNIQLAYLPCQLFKLGRCCSNWKELGAQRKLVTRLAKRMLLYDSVGAEDLAGEYWPLSNSGTFVTLSILQSMPSRTLTEANAEVGFEVACAGGMTAEEQLGQLISERSCACPS